MDADKLTKIFCTYGFVNQALKTIEEMDELAQAITEYLSEPAYEKIIHLAEEVGDVLIMAEQLRRMVGAQCVDEWIDFKLDRTINRIERGGKDAGN